METPSSTRKVTRSQASSGSQKMKQEEAMSKSRIAGDRSALIDITNDSPVVGLATERTPSSVAKNWVKAKQTPGSGEALLRGQVKTLLQMVEEEAVVVKIAPFADRPPLRTLLGIQVSPAQLLAPTPANTPQIPGVCDVQMGEMVPSATEDDPMIPPEVAENVKQEAPLGECLLNRALLFDDSPGKSDVSVASTISYQGSGTKSSEDDNSSAWSLQVNASIQEEDEEGSEDFEQEESEDYSEEDGEEDDVCYDDLCDVLTKMTVQDEVRLPEFKGKHTRFVYNSDGEIEGEEEEEVVSPSVIRLKGLPVPEGKHLRFPEEEQD